MINLLFEYRFLYCADSDWVYKNICKYFMDLDVKSSIIRLHF